MKIGLIVAAVLLLVGMGACSKFVGVRNELVIALHAVGHLPFVQIDHRDE